MLDFARIFWSGLQQVRKSPGFILLMYAISVLVALPLALQIRSEIEASLNNSVVHENLRQGFDFAWYWQAFPRQGIAETFGPLVVGVLPIVSNLERLLNGEILNTNWVVLAAGCLLLLAWAFVNGGILDHYLNPEYSQARGRFVSSCGHYFFRFVKLLVISLATYYLVFNYVVTPLHDWIDEGAKETNLETAVMFRVFGIYMLAGGLLILCGILFDYAKIITVAEDRRSILGSCIHSVRFVLKHPITTVLLYLALVLASGLVMLLYALTAPGPEQASWFTLLVAFVLGQVYLLARLFCKLSFLACQSRLFRSKTRPEASQ